MRLASLLFILFLGVNARSQNAYYEAKFLYAFDSTIIRELLKPAAPGTNGPVFTAQEKEQAENLLDFLQNPFSDALKPIRLTDVRSAINKYNAALVGNKIDGDGFASGIAPVLFSLLPQLAGGGNLSITSEQQTMIIDAVAKYYAEEFKKAQTITYMEGLKTAMTEFGELQILFPQTFSKLKNTDPGRFPDLGNEYKDIFARDLQNIIPNLTAYIDNKTPELEPSTKPLKILSDDALLRIRTNQYYPALKISYDLGDKLLKNYPISDLLGYLDNQYGGLRKVSMLHESLKKFRQHTEGQLSAEMNKLSDESYETLLVLLKEHTEKIFPNDYRFTTAAGITAKVKEALPKLNEVLNVYYFDANKMTESDRLFLLTKLYSGESDMMSALQEAGINAVMQKNKNLGIILHTLNTVQYNLRDTTKERIWVSLQDLQTMNETEWQYFIGMMYQRDKQLFKDMNLSDINVKYETYKTYLNKQMNNMLQTLVLIQEIKKTNTDSLMKRQYVEKMFGVTMQLVENFNINPSNGKPYIEHAEMAKFISQAQLVAGIYNDIRNADYSNVTQNTVLLVKSLAYGRDFDLDSKGISKGLEKIDEFGGFMSETLRSESSDEVKNVIRKYAAQPTTFINKRERRTTLSVTGQPGYFVSRERLRIKSDSIAKDKPGKWVTGITLPLGFEYTIKFKPRNKFNQRGNAASLGLFVQLVDLGAVLNFRINDSATSDLPDDVNLKQIFAPGASLNYGFRNSPFCLGIGYQWAPPLREVTTTSGNTIMPDAHRVFIRAAWDIPLINIYKSSKKYHAFYTPGAKERRKFERMESEYRKRNGGTSPIP